MQIVQDYKKLAAQKQLEERILNLTAAREKVLADLQELGLEVPADRVVPGGRVDAETLEQDQKLIRNWQAQTHDQMLHQQAADVIAQAREGSRFVALERRLQAEPEMLEKINLAPLQDEQLSYLRKQLEIFDYLSKHFSQFGSVAESENLPEAGDKFFSGVVVGVVERAGEYVKRGRDLESQIVAKSKLLDKLKRREQRELEMIHSEVGKNLVDDEIGSPALLAQNERYQDLLAEIKSTQVLKTSLLNQANTLIDKGIDEFEALLQTLESIVGQNQTAREILYQVKVQNKIWETSQLKAYIVSVLRDFDRQMGEILVREIDNRFDEGELSGSKRRAFGDLMEEVLEFQEYLGQIMGDSLQIIEGNLDDLRQARVKFGRLVLDFYGV